MTSKVEKKVIEHLLTRKRLVTSRGVVEKFMVDYDPTCAPQVPVRLEYLDDINQQFLAVQAELEQLDKPEEFENHLRIRADHENRYCIIKGFLLSQSEYAPPAANSTMATPTLNVSRSSSSFHYRLPKIDLPKFNGDESRWISFRDSYLSMIHSNDDIPTVNKLQYLLQTLEGDAKKPFESVNIEANNYATTWNALLKKYDNKRFLRKELFRGLFNLSPMKRECGTELSTLIDDFQRYVKALDKLGEPVDHWDTPLIYILSSKLDSATLRLWEQETRQKEDVTYEELIEFLTQYVRMLKSVSNDLKHRSQGASAKVASPIPKKSSVANAASTASDSKQSKPLQCPLESCSKHHPLHQCPVFLKLSVSERRSAVSTAQLCRNCFRTNHRAQSCNSKFTCRTCHAKHHTLLHEESPKSPPSSTVTSNAATQQLTPLAHVSTGTAGAEVPPEVSLPVQAKQSTVLLETVALLVVDKHGRELPVRALLDSGSMSNFITKKLANTLAARPSAVDITVSGLGESSKQIKRQISATIKSRTSRFSTTLEFLVMKKPTANLPTIPISTTNWNLKDVQLADPNFNKPGMIDILIGSECYHEIHTGNRKTIDSELPLLIETVFGWTVSGKVPINSAIAPPLCYISTTDRSLEEAIQRFWELEAVDEGPAYSIEEISCEKLYAATTTRTPTGRYVVRLPRSQDPQVTLGDSRAIATRRFYGLEKRLAQDHPTKEAYAKFMAEYEHLGHMRKIYPVDDDKPHCYLPHHPVFRDSSTTTKVRVVFDASCKTTSGFSLNLTLLVGPVCQQDLYSIVIRFRTHVIAMVADIEKMYRQIEVHPDDQPLQRILWRASPSEPLATYELLTVTYGTASAPYLATRTLRQLAQDEGDNYPEAAEAVSNDFYVDDILTGAPDIETAIAKRRQISAMLASAGLPLRKWASNSPDALVDVPPEDLAIKPLHDLQEDQSVSTLGLVWDIKNDMLRFNVQLPPPAPILTKRHIMKYIASIWDPLGLTGPVIVTAKLVMQSLWKLMNDDDKPYEWDRPLPQKIQDKWKQFHNQLHIISELQIPRFVSLAAATKVELHFFSDASENAYGVCCYVRAECLGAVRTQLLTSKSKVAPLATKHSIARLELCGAFLASKLYWKIKNSFKDSAAVFWVDSLTTLQWLKSAPGDLRTFVGNRVSPIQVATKGCTWRHVPGVENPADELSRGLSPTELMNRSRWWNGPAWLSKPPSHWPNAAIPEEQSAEVIKEVRKVALITLIPTVEQFADQLFVRFSSYSKLRRTVAIWLKFIRWSKNKDEPNFLTTANLTDADRGLIRLAQSQMFPKEIKALESAEPNRLKKSNISNLKPFLNEHNILCVGGRLSNAEVTMNAKHPVLLSAKHPLATLLADYYHKTLLHAGPQLMLSTIRQKYWILGARNLTRNTYHRCVKCFRCKPNLVKQSVADLPKTRVTPARPFSISGVDYCGPVYLKSPVRNRAPTKAYVAIFVCFATKAVHIELVSDLSTDAFLSALRRFTSRRSRPQELHSDNGTAFKGANNALHRIYEMLKSSEADRKKIQTFCADQQITWKFIPPRAPHFGGLWEAAVKSAKHHLLREIGQICLNQEDMTTLLHQIEMCLNSRPLTPIPTEADDLDVLTPGHFLVGSNMQAVPEASLVNVPNNRLNHWQLTQKMFQCVWARWYPEYLTQLQSRAKACNRSPVPIEIGRIVVIKDDNLPPIQWPLGKITQLHPGKDGIVRVVTLKTADADKVVRPVARIALLPMAADLQPE